jgi:phosphoglycerate dehydrogenase-like enzyme
MIPHVVVSTDADLDVGAMREALPDATVSVDTLDGEDAVLTAAIDAEVVVLGESGPVSARMVRAMPDLEVVAVVGADADAVDRDAAATSGVAVLVLPAGDDTPSDRAKRVARDVQAALDGDRPDSLVEPDD